MFGMVPLVELFMVGSLWYYILLVGLFVVITFLSELEKSFTAITVFLLGLAAFQFLGDTDVLGYLWHNPLWIFGGVILYTVIGTGWSLGKWRFYSSDQRETYDNMKEDWLSQHKVSGPKVPANLMLAWEKHLKDYRRCVRRDGDSSSIMCVMNMELTLEEVKEGKGPRFKNHISRCVNWATFWPCSAFWTLLNDPLRKLFRKTVLSLRSVYEAIAIKTWEGVANDFQQEVGVSGNEKPRPDGKPLPPK